MCVFVIPAASVVICLFQGCLTLWIIRSVARRWWSRPKVRWWQRAVTRRRGRWCQRIDTDLSFSLSYTRSASPYHRRRSVLFRSCNIGGRRARGWLPPPYGHALFAATVILTYIRHRRAHPVDECIRDVAANTAALTHQPHPLPPSYDAPLRHLFPRVCCNLYLI